MDTSSAVMVGIDLGAKSIGWTVSHVMTDAEGRMEPAGLVTAGSRCFEAGVDGDIEKGKDEARAVARRMARGARRNLQRRAQRLRATLRALGEQGLLPGAVASPPEARKTYLDALDPRLLAKMLADGEPAGAVYDSPVYQMRRRVLDGARDLEEIGRALFHLAQRRGFKSNRKDTSNDDEKGKVKAGIAHLARDIRDAGARTLGEYFSRLDPHQTRIRSRWTARSMYEAEFDAIWDAQAPHHPSIMTDAAKNAIHHAIFFQRPLKSAKNLIGLCELEAPRRRAPMGCLTFQRFRIVQTVNDLTWKDETGALRGPLGVDDPRRMELINHLDACAELGLADAKKLLGLHAKSKLMIENGPTKKLTGNKTVAKLQPALGGQWEKWSPRQREEFVNELLGGLQQDHWERRLGDYWKLPPEVVESVADVGLQPGYGALSRRAMRKLLVEMEAGVPLATARKKLYGDAAKAYPPMDRLPGILTPAVRRRIGKINNPAVIRALTELRKVVNELIAEFGKPVRFRVELARDIRNTREARKKMSDNIADRTKERDGFKNAMIAALPNDFGGREPRRDDIEKWALAEECDWLCPYTGKSITPETLFGPDAQFDIEHIIPRSRRPDDSFINKTLCHNDANRAKGDRTPFEAFHGTPAWDAILTRAARFKSSAARAKLRLFTLETIDDDFTNRDLADTRYASRLAKEYLGFLYGGVDGVDESGNRCVQVCSGGITAIIRNELGLNKLLSDDGAKNREDHRHHAVDAIAIVLAGPAMVKNLSDAAARATAEGRRRYARIAEPWADFLTNARAIIDPIVVSHRVDHTLGGALHKQTNFSPPKSRPDPKTGKPTEVAHVRKKLVGITPGQIDAIVDPAVKKAVVDFLKGRDPKSVFKVGDNVRMPTLLNKKDRFRPIPIRKVRIWEKNSVISVGAGGAARNVVPGENNHLEILAFTDKKGEEQWDITHIVSRFEAHRRLRNDEPVVRKDHGPDMRYVMKLHRGDYLEMDIAGTRRLMRVTSIGHNWIQTQPPEYGAAKMEKADRNAWLFQGGKGFRSANPLKVTISPAGKVRRSNE